MHSCSKFQLTLRTSSFGTNFAKKNMNDKKLEKINIKFEISIWQCTHVPHLLENFSFCDQICPKSTLGWSIRSNPT